MSTYRLFEQVLSNIGSIYGLFEGLCPTDLNRHLRVGCCIVVVQTEMALTNLK